MQLRTLTWNIGGGKLLTPGADPSLIASYGRDGIADIASIIKESGANIVALQEVQQGDAQSQVEQLASLAEYKYFFYDVTSDSHIEEGHKLGHGILSKYPISNHHIELFNNPKVRIEWEDGSIATSFDKGFSSCDVDVNGIKISVTTLHLIPFRRFDISLDSKLATEILTDVSNKLGTNSDIRLIMGDFNIDDSHLVSYFSELFREQELGEVEIDVPTTPKGRRYDHVMFKGIRYKSKQINSSVLTDHYPVVCTFVFHD